MILENETNTLYLAGSLLKRHPNFFKRFEKVLSDCNIRFMLLPNTKDIWAIDYMPVQISRKKFVQFTYNPDYLQDRLWRETISDVDSICKAIKLTPQKSNLVVDGGNVTRTKDKVIMCDKVFTENSNVSEKKLIEQLEELFEVDKLYFVPWEINDITGHADGMVRFVTDDFVLINDYSEEDEEFQRSFRMSLHNARLDWKEIPYDIYQNESVESARGLYLNYLQMKQAVIVPVFKRKADEKAMKILEEVFKGQKVVSLEANEIADEGGILNCITWNIRV